MLSSQIQRRLLHTFLHHNYRHRFQDPDDRIGREEGQATDMGHSGAGKIQDHHDGILQRRYGNTACI